MLHQLARVTIAIIMAALPMLVERSRLLSSDLDKRFRGLLPPTRPLGLSAAVRLIYSFIFVLHGC
jgi:hypothetical protein